MIFFGILLLIFLIGIYPFWDKKYTKRLEATGHEADRISYFKYVIYSEWTITFLLLVAVSVSSTKLAQIGLKLPDENSVQFLGMLSGFLVGILAVTFILSRIPFYQKYQKLQTNNVSYLIPTGKLDKRYAVMTAITAGICEEIIYRGFLLHFLSRSPFSLEGSLLLLTGAVIFGIAHYYQGWKGVMLTGLVGFALSRVYVETGSLIFPILLHILIDLRFMLFVKKD
ncbi:CPBP family intramembrane glutamic endopeptidase [Bacillus tuaregi]|uniref:CPBP family intramembrane glutamic endopeptidase n=1 Tax=Bacillus tuaregi TaxID=1816695 RepID=UPI0008F87311|nr:CPBP family intramembrane glutamic endopeptidase [Bacillus tuaregi]